MEVICRECGVSNFTPKEKVLLILHANGQVELYGDRIDLQIVQRPLVMVAPSRVVDAELLLEEYVESELRLSHRRIFYPCYLKGFEKAASKTPRELARDDYEKRVFQTAEQSLREWRDSHLAAMECGIRS